MPRENKSLFASFSSEKEESIALFEKSYLSPARLGSQ
jgi:hypothetical protein